jgi:hypothetical protein
MKFVLLVYMFLFWSEVYAKPSCNSLLRVSGYISEMTVNNEIRLCLSTKESELIEIDFSSEPTRSFAVSSAAYSHYLSNVKKTMDRFDQLKSSPGVCRNHLNVYLDWGGIKKNFSGCDGDAKALIAQKLSSLIRDVYYENK